MKKNKPKIQCWKCGSTQHNSGDCGVTSRILRRQITKLRADRKALRKECREWQETFAALLERLPEPERMLVCAKLATIPKIWNGLSPKHRAQASLILGLAKAA